MRKLSIGKFLYAGILIFLFSSPNLVAQQSISQIKSFSLGFLSELEKVGQQSSTYPLGGGYYLLTSDKNTNLEIWSLSNQLSKETENKNQLIQSLEFTKSEHNDLLIRWTELDHYIHDLMVKINNLKHIQATTTTETADHLFTSFNHSLEKLHRSLLMMPKPIMDIVALEGSFLLLPKAISESILEKSSPLQTKLNYRKLNMIWAGLKFSSLAGLGYAVAGGSNILPSGNLVIDLVSTLLAVGFAAAAGRETYVAAKQVAPYRAIRRSKENYETAQSKAAKLTEDILSMNISQMKNRFGLVMQKACRLALKK